MHQMIKLLIIDDDQEECVLFEEALQQVDPTVQLFCLRDARKTLDTIDAYHPTLVFTDINMPLVSGIDCLREIKRRYPEVPVIMYSGIAHKAKVAQAYELGASMVFQKPNLFGDLVAGLRTILVVDWSDHQAVVKQFHGTVVYFPLGRQQTG